MSIEMPMSLADMWNKALTKRTAPVETPMPQAQRTPKRCKSTEGDTQISDHTMLEEALNEMSDDGVDAALHELLQDGTELSHPDKQAKGRSSACGLPSCCVWQRKAPARVPARPPPLRKANLPALDAYVPNGTNGAKLHVINGAPSNGAPPKGGGHDDSPNSVMRMLYPNLFH